MLVCEPGHKHSVYVFVFCLYQLNSMFKTMLNHGINLDARIVSIEFITVECIVLFPSLSFSCGRLVGNYKASQSSVALNHCVQQLLLSRFCLYEVCCCIVNTSVIVRAQR